MNPELSDSTASIRTEAPSSSTDSTPSISTISPAPPVAVHLDPSKEGYLLTKNGLLFQQKYQEITVRKTVKETTPEIMASLMSILKEKYPGAPENMMTVLSMSLPMITTLLAPWSPSLQEGMDLGRHPKIPYSALQRMLRAMRLWNDKFHSELTLLMHFDEKPNEERNGSSLPTSNERSMASDQQILVLFPRVISTTGTSVRFELGNVFCRRCLTTATDKKPEKQHKCGCGTVLEPINLLLTAHTHPNMEAFCSGTDDEHEKPHVAFHMTVGHIEATPTFVVSFCDGSGRFPIRMEDLFEAPNYTEIDEIARGWIALHEKEKKAPTPPTANLNDPWDGWRADRAADIAADKIRRLSEGDMTSERLQERDATFFKEFQPAEKKKAADKFEEAAFVAHFKKLLDDKHWVLDATALPAMPAPAWLGDIFDQSVSPFVDQAEEALSAWGLDTGNFQLIDTMAVLIHLMDGEDLLEFTEKVLEAMATAENECDPDSYDELERVLRHIYDMLTRPKEDPCNRTSSSSVAAASATT